MTHDSAPRYAVGIDLGTTNSALSYIELVGSRRKTAKVENFEIPQLLDVGEAGRRPLLPSFAYLAGKHEMGAVAELPWPVSSSVLVGEAARRQGGRVPSRLISSAKSWLCHSGVDRTAAILPWHAEEEVPRISPVEATTLYLKHLVDAWNATIGKVDPASRLERQAVVLTVPASFDEGARELTLEAAAKAGIPGVTLLEEPQAAFYHWLHDAPGRRKSSLPVGSVCVVIDVGGGTTDFSLIGVHEQDGKAEYRRLAVGEHLLLGGDNMDLAVARCAEERLTPGARLDASQWGGLVLACRRAKEQLLADEPTEHETVTVLGKGRKVVGGLLSCELERSTVVRLVLDGFFPRIGFGEQPLRSGVGGLREFGLPYVADAAVTRHLASFLRQHAGAISALRGEDHPAPNAVLFNGGVFNAPSCQRQVLEVMRSWFGSAWEPEVLATKSLDLAVARGAAVFAWAREVGASRIQSDAARSYYIGVETESSQGSAIQSALCLVPHGLATGELVHVDKPTLELQLGQPVSFPLYTSTVRTHDRAGELIQFEAGSLAELPALTTVLRGGRRASVRRAPVALEARLTEIGTLEIHCVAKDSDQRWKLQFQTRALPTTSEEEEGEPNEIEAPSAPLGTVDVWSEDQLDEARRVIASLFPDPRTPGDVQEVAGAAKLIEVALGSPRDRWPTSVLRSLFETLLDRAAGRKASIEHEARWYNLVGYCLRPGFGDPLDAHRVEQCWKQVHAGVVQTKSDRVWTEYWILCRRAAGGFDAKRQRELAGRLQSYVQAGPGGKKSPRRVGGNELSEIWRALSSLELLPPALKTQLGDALVKQAGKPPIPRHVFWSLARLGARVLVRGPANVVVPREKAEHWIARLLAVDIADAQWRMERGFALAQIARRSGDRVLDVGDEIREQVLAELAAASVQSHWSTLVREGGALDAAEEGRVLGDSLPPGLRVAGL